MKDYRFTVAVLGLLLSAVALLLLATRSAMGEDLPTGGWIRTDGQPIPVPLDTGGWQSTQPANPFVCDPSNPKCGPEGCGPKAMPMLPPDESEAADVRAIEANLARFAKPSPPGANPAVCRVHTIGTRKGYSATGVLVDANGRHALVMTNAHLVRGLASKTQLSVEFPNRARCAGRLVHSSEAVDLAMVIILDYGIKPVRVATAPPKVGDAVVLHGYGSGSFRSVSGRITNYESFGTMAPVFVPGKGMKTGRETTGGGANSFRVDVATREGDSGSAVFNAQGQVAGIMWGGDDNASSVVPCSVVDRFVTTSAQYLAPWNAKIEREQIRAEADVEVAKIQAGAQQAIPYPTGPDPGLSGRVSQLEGRVGAIEGQVDSVKTALAGAETAAGKAVADALGGPGGVAGLVTKEFEKQSPGFLEKAKSVAGGALRMVPGMKWLLGLGFGGMTLGVGGLGIVIWLLRSGAHRAAAGEPTRGQAIASRTRNTADDYLADVGAMALRQGYKLTHPGEEMAPAYSVREQVAAAAAAGAAAGAAQAAKPSPPAVPAV